MRAPAAPVVPLGSHALRWYCVVVTGDFEFWTTKAGPDGFKRISVRPSGQGWRESWLVAAEEGERDILKRWVAFHLEQVGFLPPWARAWR